MAFREGMRRVGLGGEGVRGPSARTDDLLVEVVDEEIIVYDQRSRHVHCLTPDAARAWRACDGRTPIPDLHHAAGIDPETVTRALEELEECDLLHHPSGLTRRDLAAGAFKVGAAAAAGAPLIYSIAAPAPALALSAHCIAVNGSAGACTGQPGIITDPTQCAACTMGGGTCTLTTPGAASLAQQGQTTIIVDGAAEWTDRGRAVIYASQPTPYVNPVSGAIVAVNGGDVSGTLTDLPVFTLSPDGTVTRQTSPPDAVYRPNHTAGVRAAAFSPTGNLFVVATPSGYDFRVYTTDTSPTATTPLVGLGDTVVVDSDGLLSPLVLGFNSAGTQIATADSDYSYWIRVSLFTVDGTSVGTATHGTPVFTSTSFLPSVFNSSLTLLAGSDYSTGTTILAYSVNTTTGDLTAVPGSGPLPADVAPLAMAFSPTDPNLLAVVCSDGNVRTYFVDSSGFSLIATIPTGITDQSMYFGTIAFSPDGSLLAVGVDDHEPDYDYLPKDSYVVLYQVAADGTLAQSGSPTVTTFIPPVGPGYAIGHPYPPQWFNYPPSLAFSGDGTQLIAGGYAYMIEITATSYLSVFGVTRAGETTTLICVHSCATDCTAGSTALAAFCGLSAGTTATSCAPNQ